MPLSYHVYERYYVWYILPGISAICPILYLVYTPCYVFLISSIYSLSYLVPAALSLSTYIISGKCPLSYQVYAPYHIRYVPHIISGCAHTISSICSLLYLMYALSLFLSHKWCMLSLINNVCSLSYLMKHSLISGVYSLSLLYVRYTLSHF